MTTARQKAMLALRAHALSLPGAHEDFPWGESVVKVGKKVFVFLGREAPGEPVGISTKLPESADAALALPFVTPTGYGLGKSGWVSSAFSGDDEIPVDLLREWITESYRAVAPKTLARALVDGAGKASQKTPAPTTSTKSAKAKTAPKKKPPPSAKPSAAKGKKKPAAKAPTRRRT